MSRPQIPCDPKPLFIGLCGCGCDGPVCKVENESIYIDSYTMLEGESQVLSVQNLNESLPCGGEAFFWYAEQGSFNSESGLEVIYTAPLVTTTDTIQLKVKHPQCSEEWEGCLLQEVQIMIGPEQCACIHPTYTGVSSINNPNTNSEFVVDIGLTGSAPSSAEITCNAEYTWSMRSGTYASPTTNSLEAYFKSQGDVYHTGNYFRGYPSGKRQTIVTGGAETFHVTYYCKGTEKGHKDFNIAGCCSCSEGISIYSGSTATYFNELITLQVTNKLGSGCGQDVGSYQWSFYTKPAGATDAYLEAVGDPSGDTSEAVSKVFCSSTSSVNYGAKVNFFTGTASGTYTIQIKCQSCAASGFINIIVDESNYDCTCAGEIAAATGDNHYKVSAADLQDTDFQECGPAWLLDSADTFEATLVNRGNDPCPSAGFNWSLSDPIITTLELSDEEGLTTSVYTPTIDPNLLVQGCAVLTCGCDEDNDGVADVSISNNLLIRSACDDINGLARRDGESSAEMDTNSSLDLTISTDIRNSNVFRGNATVDLRWTLASGAPSGASISGSGVNATLSSGSGTGTATVRLSCRDWGVVASANITIRSCTCGSIISISGPNTLGTNRSYNYSLSTDGDCMGFEWELDSQPGGCSLSGFGKSATLTTGSSTGSGTIKAYCKGAFVASESFTVYDCICSDEYIDPSGATMALESTKTFYVKGKHADLPCPGSKYQWGVGTLGSTSGNGITIGSTSGDYVTATSNETGGTSDTLGMKCAQWASAKSVTVTVEALPT